MLGEPTDLDTLRLRNEFVEMPGLAVSIAQAARLLDVRLEHARAMLEALEREGFLARNDNGLYRRSVDCSVSSRHLSRYL